MALTEEYLRVLDRIKQFMPNIPPPVINFSCETKCQYARYCDLLGCYYMGTINLKTGVPPEVLVHEYGHYIFDIAMGGRVSKVESEKFARFFEKNFSSNVVCDVCGGRLTYSVDCCGVHGYCSNCGAEYYADVLGQTTGETAGRDVVYTVIATGIVSALLTAFITQSLPTKEDSPSVRMEKISRIVASVVSAGFVGIVVQLMKG
jgi:hypothetical protein